MLPVGSPVVNRVDRRRVNPQFSLPGNQPGGLLGFHPRNQVLNRCSIQVPVQRRYRVPCRQALLLTLRGFLCWRE